MADALRPTLPEGSAEDDDASSSQANGSSSQGNGDSSVADSSAAAATVPRTVDGNGSSGEEHAARAEHTQQGVSPRGDSSSAAGGSSGASVREEIVEVKDYPVAPASKDTSASAAAESSDAAHADESNVVQASVTETKESAVSGSASGCLLRASSSIEDSDSEDAAERVAVVQQEAPTGVIDDIDSGDDAQHVAVAQQETYAPAAASQPAQVPTSAQETAVEDAAKEQEEVEVEDITPTQQTDATDIARQRVQQVSQSVPALGCVLSDLSSSFPHLLFRFFLLLSFSDCSDNLALGSL